MKRDPRLPVSSYGKELIVALQCLARFCHAHNVESPTVVLQFDATHDYCQFDAALRMDFDRSGMMLSVDLHRVDTIAGVKVLLRGPHHAPR